MKRKLVGIFIPILVALSVLFSLNVSAQYHHYHHRYVHHYHHRYVHHYHHVYHHHYHHHYHHYHH